MRNNRVEKRKVCGNEVPISTENYCQIYDWLQRYTQKGKTNYHKITLKVSLKLTNDSSETVSQVLSSFCNRKTCTKTLK